jgi:hypothetical protein
MGHLLNRRHHFLITLFGALSALTGQLVVCRYLCTFSPGKDIDSRIAWCSGATEFPWNGAIFGSRVYSSALDVCRRALSRCKLNKNKSVSNESFPTSQGTDQMALEEHGYIIVNVHLRA